MSLRLFNSRATSTTTSGAVYFPPKCSPDDAHNYKEPAQSLLQILLYPDNQGQRGNPQNSGYLLKIDVPDFQ